MKVEMKLKEMGIELPEMAAPKGSYIPVSRTGNLLFLSGQLPTQNNALIYEGHVGSDVTLEQAQEAARLCMINALAAIKATIGDLDQIKKIVKVQKLCEQRAGLRVAARRDQWRERLFRRGPWRKREACPHSGGGAGTAAWLADRNRDDRRSRVK